MFDHYFINLLLSLFWTNFWTCSISGSYGEKLIVSVSCAPRHCPAERWTCLRSYIWQAAAVETASHYNSRPWLTLTPWSTNWCSVNHLRVDDWRHQWLHVNCVCRCFVAMSFFFVVGQVHTGFHHHHHTTTVLRSFFPGPPGWAGRHSIRTNQFPPPPHPIFFTDQMPFLPPYQQRQSTEGN